jgi:hypothetical protein
MLIPAPVMPRLSCRHAGPHRHQDCAGACNAGKRFPRGAPYRKKPTVNVATSSGGGSVGGGNAHEAARSAVCSHAALMSPTSALGPLTSAPGLAGSAQWLAHGADSKSADTCPGARMRDGSRRPQSKAGGRCETQARVGQGPQVSWGLRRPRRGRAFAPTSLSNGKLRRASAAKIATECGPCAETSAWKLPVTATTAVRCWRGPSECTQSRRREETA